MKIDKDMPDRRESLVDAAYSLIAERGLEGLRTRDIAARAGIHHATLHYYFPTKEDLVKAVADRLDEEFVAANALSHTEEMAARPIMEQLGFMFASFQRQMRENPERFLVVSELFQHARRHPATMALMRRPHQGEECMRSMFEEGVRRGQIPRQFDITATMHCILAFSMGLSVLIAKHPQAAPATTAQFLQILQAAFLNQAVDSASPGL